MQGEMQGGEYVEGEFQCNLLECMYIFQGEQIQAQV